MSEADSALVADALQAHDHEDWYTVLLFHAVGEVGNVPDAIKVADMVYLEQPTDDSEPTEDDEDALTENVKKRVPDEEPEQLQPQARADVTPAQTDEQVVNEFRRLLEQELK